MPIPDELTPRSTTGSLPPDARPKATAEEGARKAIDAAATAAEGRGDDETANLLRLLGRYDPTIVTQVVADQYFGERIKERWQKELKKSLQDEIDLWRGWAKWLGGIGALLGLGGITWIGAQLTALSNAKGTIKKELAEEGEKFKTDVNKAVAVQQGKVTADIEQVNSRIKDLERIEANIQTNETERQKKEEARQQKLELFRDGLAAKMQELSVKIGIADYETRAHLTANKETQESLTKANSEIATKQSELTKSVDRAINETEKLKALDELAFEARKVRVFELVFLRRNQPEKVILDIPEPGGQTHKLEVTVTFQTPHGRGDSADMVFDVIEGRVPNKIERHILKPREDVWLDRGKTVALRLEALRNEMMAHAFVMVSLRMPPNEDLIRAGRGVDPTRRVSTNDR